MLPTEGGDGGHSGCLPLELYNLGGSQGDLTLSKAAERPAAVQCFVETHATAIMQNQFKKLEDSRHMLWGDALPLHSSTGVLVAVRRSMVWDAQRIGMKDAECKKFERQGRLMAAQLFFSNGKQALLIYLIYGLSGSRGCQAQRAVTLRILRSAAKDAASRGGVATLIMGDINLEPQETGGFC